jgi:hypothetical protein
MHVPPGFRHVQGDQARAALAPVLFSRTTSTGQTTPDSCRETKREQQLRTVVFLNETIPWWWSPVGYVFFGILGVVCIPLMYAPGAHQLPQPGLAVASPVGCTSPAHAPGLQRLAVSSHGSMCAHFMRLFDCLQ